VRKITLLKSACLFSATLAIPDGAPCVTRDLRTLIASGYLRDYHLDIPVFCREATYASLVRHLVYKYEHMIVVVQSRDEGVAFTGYLNACAHHGTGMAKFVDCRAFAAEHKQIVDEFKSDALPFIVVGSALAAGIDAPNASAVCLLHVKASATEIVNAMGLALRPHPAKITAALVLPFIGDADYLAGARRARDVLRVCAQTDTAFARSLRTSGWFVNIPFAGRERVDDQSDDEEALEEEGGDDALLRIEIFDTMSACAPVDDA
jgi:superfamily II DNA or RNA helicase